MLLVKSERNIYIFVYFLLGIQLALFKQGLPHRTSCVCVCACAGMRVSFCVKKKNQTTFDSASNASLKPLFRVITSKYRWFLFFFEKKQDFPQAAYLEHHLWKL